MKYAEVKIDKYIIPLIGIKEEYGLEKCDLCNDNSLRLFFDEDNPTRKWAIIARNGKNICCNRCSD